MRIAIASDDGQTLANHTGRCRCFLIFDVENDRAKQIDVRSNSFTAHAQGECTGHESENLHEHNGEHHSHGTLLYALADCQALIARGMGRRLVNDLQANNMMAICCQAELAEEAASLFATGQLAQSDWNACGHG